MPAAAAMSRVPVAAKPLLRKSLAAPSISWRRRLPSLRSCAVLRGRPRGRRGGGAGTTGAGGRGGGGGGGGWGVRGGGCELLGGRGAGGQRKGEGGLRPGAGACMGATI